MGGLNGSPVFQSRGFIMSGKALGVSMSVDAVAAATGYTAHSSGATPVTSDAATDLDTTAAQVAILTTKVNAVLTALKENGLMDS
jgi:hypothetical protein